jgi:hypothetical protein
VHEFMSVFVATIPSAKLGHLVCWVQRPDYNVCSSSAVTNVVVERNGNILE